MNLADAIAACRENPGLGFRLAETDPGDFLFLDSCWFDRGWLAYWDAGVACVCWWPSLAAVEAARTDWLLVPFGPAAAWHIRQAYRSNRPDGRVLADPRRIYDGSKAGRKRGGLLVSTGRAGR